MSNTAQQNLMAMGQDICPILKDHYKQPREVKEALLQADMAAQYLLENLPSEEAEILREGFLAGQFGENVPGFERVRRYFSENSEIIPALQENPGTFTMLERMYHLIPSLPPIDQYFLMSVAGGQALHFRYNRVTSWIIYMVSQVLGRQENCLMVDIGSGPARNVIDAFSHHPGLRGRLNVECVEIDPVAIKKGKELLADEKLGDSVKFVPKSMVGKEFLIGNQGRFDLGINIGVVCGMKRDDRVRLLAAHRRLFKSGGRLIVAGLTKRMAELDLFCAYVLRETADWLLQFRPLGELAQDAQRAGWKVIRTFHEGPGHLYDIVELEAA